MIFRTGMRLDRLVLVLIVGMGSSACRGGASKQSPPQGPGSAHVEAGPAPRPDPEPGGGIERERGAEVQYGPNDLRVALRINGVARGGFRDGELVRSGDHLQLTIQTREASHVYLAYCTRDRELAWFPPRGSVVTRPDEAVIAPAPNAAIVLDDNLGPEVLYVVVSRSELSLADPELGKAVERARGGGSAADCGEALGDRRRESRSKGARQRPRAAPQARPAAPRDRAKAVEVSAATAYAPDEEPERAPRPVGLVRGGALRWDDLEQATATVDASGIAILRYGFEHVARSP
jgi:hypothetical protein